MIFPTKAIMRGTMPVLACLLLPAAALSAVYRYNATDYFIPGNITVPSGDYREYEGLDTVQNDGKIEYESGSTGVFAAGTKISLLGSTTTNNDPGSPFHGRKMGFMAHEGSKFWALIDENFNGISDYVEELDADGDGMFDALEDVMGTSNGQGVEGFEVDGDGDGIFDRVFDVSSGGTPSQLIPGAFMGYKNRLRSFHVAYGHYNSVSASFGDGFLDSFLGSLSEWLDFNFSVTYSYFSFDGWRHGVTFTPESASKTYILQGYFPGTGWVDLSNEINQATEWTGYSNTLVGSLSDLPPFMRILELGKAVAAAQTGNLKDALEIVGLGELLPNDQLKLNLPEILGVPQSVADDLDWGIHQGSTGPGWDLDLDGDGISEVHLDPINQSLKVSIPVLGQHVDITVDKNGVEYALGKFKVKRNNNGELVVDLPTNAIGTDGVLSLSFSPSANINVYRPQPFQGTVPRTLNRADLVVPIKEINDNGVGIRINLDDDNQNGTKDGLESASVSGENDLIEVQFGFNITTSSNDIKIKTPNNLKVWGDSTRQDLLVDESSEAVIPSHYHPPGKLWVECVGPVQRAEVEIIVVTTQGPEYTYEKIPFVSFKSMIVGLSGETFVVMGDVVEQAQSNGVNDICNELLKRGYDVAYYDEDVINGNGLGLPYDAYVQQIKHCSISSIGILGHSHGGGSTYHLSRRLNDNKSSIGTFSEKYNAYIDAIKEDLTSAEDRMPPGSMYLLNYYQREGPLKGDSVSGAANHDWTSKGKGHGGIDNDPPVILDILAKAYLKISP